jgi:superfamily II DNA or RNA helicase
VEKGTLTTIAPGARVLIRDEEWIVRSAELCDVGGYQLDCIGVSETVRHRNAIFLTEIDQVTPLDPKETQLVADTSPRYIASLLYLEVRLRQTVPTDTAISIGHRGAMDSLPFQLEPTRRVLQQLRPRFLIADSVGLGKTLEAGALVAELIRRGRGRRILVVTTKSMMQQFQKEFWTRFSIPLTRLDSAGIQRVRRHLPTNYNPFYYYDKTIISVDTLKRDIEYRHYLEKAWWDVIVIDEAHNVSYKGNRTQTNKLATLLASRSDSLVLLTATPHSGDRESFASLMRMLDPTALPNKAEYTKQDVEHLFVRRFKKDVKDEIRQYFPERRVFRFKAAASPAEERAFACLGKIKLTIDDEKRSGAEMLFRTTLEKALLSSPAACAKTVRERLRRLKSKDPAHPDLGPLHDLLETVETVKPDEVSKLNELVARLASDQVWRWSKDHPSDRFVVFTERIETLRFLREHLARRLGLAESAVAILHGQLSDMEIQATVEEFGKTKSKLRLLIASDVASEGLNLHFQSHRLVHFDIPWSLMVFQQRNGRVDRYGQKETPLIAYLLNQTIQPKIKGDLRILEILTEKDEQAAKNIGDPSIFMGFYDEEKETQRVAEALERGESAEAFDASLTAKDDGLDWLDTLMGGGEQPKAPPAPTVAALSLFESDYQYVREGLAYLHSQDQLARSSRPHPEHSAVELQPDDDLDRYLRQQLSLEMRPADNVYILSANPQIVQNAIETARNTDEWPATQYLWPLHPMVQWLDFKMLSLFGRQRAPVVRVQRGVSTEEALVLVSALIPNRRGQPVLNEWFAVRVALNRSVMGELSFEEMIAATGLGREDIPNAESSHDAAGLQALLAPALDFAQRRMAEQHKMFSAVSRRRAAAELEALAKLRRLHHEQLELSFTGSAAHFAKPRERQRETKASDIDKLFTEYETWVSQTLELDSRAHLTVDAVFVT